jgi:tRNA pseudouridine55 synthase
VDATVRCSSGTYIRALARDLGVALGTGGHLTALRRTAVGPYTLAQARTLNELEAQNQNDPERVLLTPGPDATSPGVTPLAEAAAAAFPCVDLTADETRRLAQGARLPLPQHGLQHGPPTAANGPGTPLAAFAPDGALVALVTEEGGRLRSLAVFVDAAGVGPR